MMACPFCGCATVYQYDDEDDQFDDRLQKCAACFEVFDLDDHADDEEDVRECRTNPAQGVDSPMEQVPTPGTMNGN